MSSQIIATILNESVTESDSTIINQENGKVYATGIIQDLEKENRNGRIYPVEEMDSEIKGERLQELIAAGYLRGHAGHPSSNELSIQSVIDPKLVCVQFDKIWRDGKLIRANFHGAGPYGDMFNKDLIDGCKPAFSFRGLGSVDRDKSGKCYVRNIRAITWDHVIYPSHKIAYMRHLIDPKDKDKTFNESANILLNDTQRNYYNSCMITNEMANVGSIITVKNQDVVDYIKNESANVKSILENFDVFYDAAIITDNGKNVILKTKAGETISINLEQYIQDSIMDYCSR